jgi:hypothetical protein
MMPGMVNALRRIGAAILLIVFATGLPTSPSAQSQNGHWLPVTLPLGVSIEIPKNWTPLSNNTRLTIETGVDARLDLSNLPRLVGSELPFAANLFDDKGHAIALMNIRYYSDIDVTHAEARRATKKDVDELDIAIRRSMEQASTAFGWRIVRWHGTEKRTINGTTIFVTEYTRSPLPNAPPGNRRVRLARVLDGPRSFTLTVSYYEPQEYVLRPISEKIIVSLRSSAR